MSLIESRLEEIGLIVPDPPIVSGNYLPFRICGNILYVSGMLCLKNGELTHVGSVGVDQTVESGYEGARVCAVNALAAFRDALGDLSLIHI